MDVGVEVTEISEDAEDGAIESALYGWVAPLGVVSPSVMVETELPDGDDDRNEAWGGSRSLGSAVMILLAGRGGVGNPD